MDEDGTAGGVQQKLMRHADVSTVANVRGNASMNAKLQGKAKLKSKRKAVQPVLPKVAYGGNGASPEGHSL